MANVEYTTSPPPSRTPARRGFLALLAGTVAMPAAAVAAPLSGARTTGPIIEAPELLAIGDQLSGLLDTYRSALKRRDESVALFERLCLPIPAELVLPPPSPQLRWVDYQAITRENVNFLTCKRIDDKRVYDSKALKIHIIQREVPSTTKEGRRLRRLARIATKFEKDRDAALSACGYLECEEAVSDAGYDLHKLARATIAAPLPRTPLGVGIVAQAMSAFGEILEEEGNAAPGVSIAAALGRRLAEGMLSITSA